MTQDTRFAIINSLVAHPIGLPSLVELNLMMDEHKSTIYEHIQQLISSDIVTRYEHDDADHPQNLPRVFYGLTPTGYSIVTQSAAFDDIHTIRDAYAPSDDLSVYLDVDRPSHAQTLDDLQANE